MIKKNTGLGASQNDEKEIVKVTLKGSLALMSLQPVVRKYKSKVKKLIKGLDGGNFQEAIDAGLISEYNGCRDFWGEAIELPLLDVASLKVGGKKYGYSKIDSDHNFVCRLAEDSESPANDINPGLYNVVMYEFFSGDDEEVDATDLTYSCEIELAQDEEFDIEKLSFGAKYAPCLDEDYEHTCDESVYVDPSALIYDGKCYQLKCSSEFDYTDWYEEGHYHMLERGFAEIEEDEEGELLEWEVMAGWPGDYDMEMPFEDYDTDEDSDDDDESEAEESASVENGEKEDGEEDAEKGFIISDGVLYKYTGSKSSVKIPESVTCIGSYAFDRCSGMSSVVIPDTVTSIGAHAFSGCTGLTSVAIPASVKEILDGAFEGCTGLTSIAVPDTVTKVGENAFEGCKCVAAQTQKPKKTNDAGKAKKAKVTIEGGLAFMKLWEVDSSRESKVRRVCRNWDGEFQDIIDGGIIPEYNGYLGGDSTELVMLKVSSLKVDGKKYDYEEIDNDCYFMCRMVDDEENPVNGIDTGIYYVWVGSFEQANVEEDLNHITLSCEIELAKDEEFDINRLSFGCKYQPYIDPERTYVSDENRFVDTRTLIYGDKCYELESDTEFDFEELFDDGQYCMLERGFVELGEDMMGSLRGIEGRVVDEEGHVLLGLPGDYSQEESYDDYEGEEDEDEDEDEEEFDEDEEEFDEDEEEFDDEEEDDEDEDADEEDDEWDIDFGSDEEEDEAVDGEDEGSDDGSWLMNELVKHIAEYEEQEEASKKSRNKKKQ